MKINAAARLRATTSEYNAALKRRDALKSRLEGAFGNLLDELVSLEHAISVVDHSVDTGSKLTHIYNEELQKQKEKLINHNISSVITILNEVSNEVKRIYVPK